MRMPRFTLRDKFLISFLGLAIVLTGMLTILAQHVYDLLPSIAVSQTQRYEAELLLRDIRETILDSRIPTDAIKLEAVREPVHEAVSRYQNSLSLSASKDTYQALAVENQGDLVRQEDDLMKQINQAMKELDMAQTLNNKAETERLYTVILDSSEKLELLNRQAADVLVSSQKGSQKFVVTFFLLSIAILLLGITVFAQMLAVWITHPLRKIQAAAIRIASGDFSHELIPDSRDELGSLTESFDYMRKKVLKSMEEVYAFAKRDETLIDSIIDSIIAVDQEGRVVLFNAAAETISGWSRLGAMRKPLDQVVSFNDQDNKIDPITMVKDVIETGKSRSFLRPITMSGTKKTAPMPITMSVAPFIEEGGRRGAVMVLKDMSEVKELDRLREEFVSIASHQLRTPLTAIRWLLEMLLKALADKHMTLDVKQQAALEQAYSRTLSMSELVSSLLALSRLDAQKIKATVAPMDMQAFCKKLEASFQGESQRHQVGITFMCTVDKPIMSDEILLTEIVSNLVSNALKYTKPDGKVSLEAMVKDKNLVVVVSDNGIGIPEEQQKSMFKKFFRAKNALSFTPDGSGIGLYMVRSFAEMLGGTIDLESKENVGSRFTLTLPIQYSA